VSPDPTTPDPRNKKDKVGPKMKARMVSPVVEGLLPKVEALNPNNEIYRAVHQTLAEGVENIDATLAPDDPDEH
jgi:hypothetical protein